MDNILDFLFCSDLRFTPSRELEAQYTAALDDVLQAEKAARAEMSAELWALVETYLDRMKKYHALDAQLEFERGFLMGSRLMLEILEGIAPVLVTELHGME